MDGYDDRSWVENGLFRNSKQFWKLTRWFPQKTEAGVHIYTPPTKPTLASLSHEQLEGQGPLRWRRRLRRANRDKVIVFVGHQYGIFYASEMLVLAGVPVRELPPHLGSRHDILRRYGCVPDA